MKVRKIHLCAYLFFLIAGIAIGSQMEKILHMTSTNSREVVLSGPSHFSLSGKVYYPRRLPGTRHPGILFCHGTLPKGKDTRLYEILLQRLAKKGYLVLSFDVRGFGDSHKVSNFQIPRDLDFIADTEAALDYMTDKLPIDRENVTIAGHSLGGNLAFAVGAKSPKVKNIVCISPGNYDAPEQYSPRRKESYIRKLENAIGGDVTASSWNRLVRALNLFNYLPLDPEKNVYLILADGDWPDIIRYSEKLFDRINTEKGLLIIPHSNHNFGTEYHEGNEVIDQRPTIALAREIDGFLQSGQ
jgi:pimeloyl-ACP methyl ester carboxylesterase